VDAAVLKIIPGQLGPGRQVCLRLIPHLSGLKHNNFGIGGHGCGTAGRDSMLAFLQHKRSAYQRYILDFLFKIRSSKHSEQPV